MMISELSRRSDEGEAGAVRMRVSAITLLQNSGPTFWHAMPPDSIVPLQFPQFEVSTWIIRTLTRVSTAVCRGFGHPVVILRSLHPKHESAFCRPQPGREAPPSMPRAIEDS